MSPKSIIENRNTPAWVSAICAVIGFALVVVSNAAAPSEQMLSDHEQRIRDLEKLTGEQLSSIDARLEAMQGEISRLRDE